MIDLSHLKEFGWCIPLAVSVLALWSQLWKCHRNKEKLITRILDDARTRESAA